MPSPLLPAPPLSPRPVPKLIAVAEPKMRDPEEFLTVPQVAERLNRSSKSIYLYIHKRRIRYVKYGTGRSARVRIKQAWVDEFLEQHIRHPEKQEASA